MSLFEYERYFNIIVYNWITSKKNLLETIINIRNPQLGERFDWLSCSPQSPWVLLKRTIPHTLITFNLINLYYIFMLYACILLETEPARSEALLISPLRSFCWALILGSYLCHLVTIQLLVCSNNGVFRLFF